MNYLIITSFLLSLSGATFAMDGEKITMPSSRTLHNKFAEAGLQDFAQNTNLINRIADKEVHPDGVRLAINTEVVDYLYVLMQHRANIKKYEHLGPQVTNIVLGTKTVARSV